MTLIMWQGKISVTQGVYLLNVWTGNICFPSSTDAGWKFFSYRISWVACRTCP